MKKRFLCILICIIFLIIILNLVFISPLLVNALDYDPEQEVLFDIQGGQLKFNFLTGSITESDGSFTSVTIPSKIGEYDVTGIGPYAFNNKSTIQTGLNAC